MITRTSLVEIRVKGPTYITRNLYCIKSPCLYYIDSLIGGMGSDILRFDSMPNFRQLVGVNKDNKIDDGESKTGRINLYRSSRPDFLTSEEIDKFRAAGIRCIIDFRSVKEYRKATGLKNLDKFYPSYKVKLPFKFCYSPDEKVVYIPLKSPSCYFSHSNGSQCQEQRTEQLGKHFLINFFMINYIWKVFNRAPWYIQLYSLLFLIVDVIFNTGYRYFVRVFAKHVLNRDGLFGQYRDMINHSKASICAALKLLTDPANIPAMLNCAHGKDRTGIVSALVLACLGKSKEEIALDYARSEAELEPIRDRLMTEIVHQFHMCHTFVTAKSETMRRVLDYIENNYGSILNYLESIGFSTKDQEALRINLTS